MFLGNLSQTVLRYCDENGLSYETASELCDLSSRYFGDIARGKTAPTILTLEKLCVGMELTPNQLLIPKEVQTASSYREPMQVVKRCCYVGLHGITCYPLCPRCDLPLEREYQNYCDRCGQCLDWNGLEKAVLCVKAK